MAEGERRSPGRAYIGGVKFLLVVIIFAAVVYFLVRLAQRGLPWGGSGGNGSGGQPRGPRRPRPSTPPRVQGPDDDPDFLREIDRKRRLQRDDGDSAT